MSIRVLLVEDDPTIAEMIERALGRLGFEVRVARDGRAGIVAFEEYAPDVALIDGLLPKQAGADVARAIRAHPRGPKTGLILVSAVYKTGPARREAYAAGFDAIFNKPYVLGEVVRTIVELAEKYTGKKSTIGSHLGKRHRKPGKVRTRENPVIPPRTATDEAPPSSDLPQTSEESLLVSSAEGVPVAPAGSPGDAAKPLVVFPGDGAATMIRLARRRATGILRFKNHQAEIAFAFSKGVIVGARDTLKENRLRDRLLSQGSIDPEALVGIETRMRENGERFLEAAIALGALEADAAFIELEAQVAHRVARGALWPRSAVTFRADREEVAKLFTAGIDVVDTVLDALLVYENPALFDAFHEENKDQPVVPTPELESALQVLARLRPSSRLPPLMFQPNMTVGRVARELGQSVLGQLWALHRAGAWHMVNKDLAPVPRVEDDSRAHRRTKAQRTRLDARVQTALLTARGKGYYAVLGLEPAAPRGDIEAALHRLEQQFGQEAPGIMDLTVGRAAARELWAILADIRSVLLDDDLRRAYDESAGLPTDLDPQVLFEDERDLDMRFLQGMLAYDGGDLASAESHFAAVLQGRPGDVDAEAFCTMARFRHSTMSAVAARAVLAALHEQEPTSLRPLLFWFDACLLSEDVATAEKVFGMAQALDPNNLEVRRRKDRLAEAT